MQTIHDWEITPQEKISNFWKEPNNQEQREWKESSLILPCSSNHIQLTLNTELKKHRILKQAGMDTLRWGYEEKGTFTTKEAYRIIIKDRMDKDQIWGKIWKPPIWPKVSTFLWLLSYNRILTWDNLRKRGFLGPSICLICNQEEETALHLMQTCQLSRKIWEKVAFRCQKEGQVLGDIEDTIRQWPQTPYQCKILNILWQTIPGFLMWNIWKERNRRIFKGQSMTMEQVWKGIHNNIRETLSTKNWSQDDYPKEPQELAIWNNWR